MPDRRILIAVVFLAASVCAVADEYQAPLMTSPPVIDGQVGDAEWQRAVAFDGLSFQGQLEERRAQAYVGATQDHLFVALVSELPTEGGILALIDKDTPKLVFDDSVEVWVDPLPGAEDAPTYQALLNALGHVTYIAHKRGAAPEQPNWRAKFEIANGFHDGFWHCEIAVPIADIVPDRQATDGAWGINVCRNWKQPWQFSSLGNGGYGPEEITFRFGASPLVVGYVSQTDPTTRTIDGALVLRNVGEADVTADAELLLNRDTMPEILTRESLTVPAGGTARLALQTTDQTTRKFDLRASVKSPDAQTTYYSRSYKWGPQRENRWTAVPPVVLPIDFNFAYYPYADKLRVLADWSGLKAGARLDGITVAVRKKGAAEPIKSLQIADPEGTRRELELDLPPLEGEYEIALTARGDDVPEGEVVKEFERTVYEWERAGLGTGTTVYPPFTPIEVEDRTVRTVLREHVMSPAGLWESVQSKGTELLAAPMSYRCTLGGEAVGETRGALTFETALGHEAIARSSLSIGALQAQATSTWDYDGMMRVDLDLQPCETPVDALTLDIPLRADQATHYHAMGDGIRNTLYTTVPEGEGVVWTSEQVNVNDFPANFCTYIYVGTPKRGLCWFAENDGGWSWDAGKPNVELVRDGDRLILRVHFVNKPITIAEPRRITFGLLAAPVKPYLEGWRTTWTDDRYSILGTDINWFSLGDCGAVYPAHKDMYLWEMLARGNQEQLSSEEIEQVVEHGRKYFEPYGEAAVESYERHVRYNLRSRYQKTMVFYYNRASYQKADEFQTFMDEWCLDDYRANSKGDGRWEIKIVPSESYIDHALYWYEKSFDVGNNKGVYWDNWFLVADYNRQLTGAYARPDGSVMPSTGIWGLRELSKRTFQYMNERGMLPITMAHMTSTNILPMHSFCTVQYDWEWRYSQGDFQDRFTRDYILLLTNGELAGAWPVLLADHGKLAADPWTQRTFAGVALVHELIGEGLPDVWNPLRDPILNLTRRDEVQVFRYWDETPQPVRADNPDLPGIVFSIPGEEAIYLVTSYAQEDAEAVVSIDPDVLGFNAGYKIVDAENGDAVTVTGNTLRFTLKKHDTRELRILPE